MISVIYKSRSRATQTAIRLWLWQQPAGSGGKLGAQRSDPIRSDPLSGINQTPPRGINKELSRCIIKFLAKYPKSLKLRVVNRQHKARRHNQLTFFTFWAWPLVINICEINTLEGFALELELLCIRRARGLGVGLGFGFGFGF